ncbi:MAG: NAD-dependent epimerase/dehydratase family protein, partial [Acidimicrobiales bacterium]
VRAVTAPDVEGKVLNIGCGKDVSIRDVTGIILDLLGNPIEARFGALPERPTEIWTMRSDNTRARDQLGWEPRHSLTEGLEKTIAWYSSELADGRSPFIVR